jgi:hypothetical protein
VKLVSVPLSFWLVSRSALSYVNVASLKTV